MFGKPFEPVKLKCKVTLLTKLKMPAVTDLTLEAALYQPEATWLEWPYNAIKQHVLRSYEAATAKDWVSALPSDAYVSLVDDYLMHTILGAARCRDEACREPLQSFELRPLVTIAARVIRANELQDATLAPDVGMLLCGAAALQATGLPVHIEAPFLDCLVQDRSISFVRTRSTGSAGSLAGMKLQRQGVRVTLNYIDIQSWNVSLVQTALESLLPPLLIDMAKLTGLTTGFYKYWPYSSRMTADLEQVVGLGQLYQALYGEKLFLALGEFKTGREIIFCTADFTAPVFEYLKQVLPVGAFAPQVGRDLVGSKKVKPVTLTPARLREALSRLRNSGASRSGNADRLRLTVADAISLLEYLLSDMLSPAVTGEFYVRNLYRQLAGCPCLPMADGTVGAFPSLTRDLLLSAPLSILALVPSLRAKAIHDLLIGRLPLFRDELFLASVNISTSPSVLVQEVARVSFPSSWTGLSAVTGWVQEGGGLFVGRGVGARSSGLPSETLMYALWNDMLAGRSDARLYQELSPVPLLPVTTRLGRVLLSTQFIRHVFLSTPTPPQDERRAFLRQETGRLISLASAEATLQLSASADQAAITDPADWAWVQQRSAQYQRSALSPPAPVEELPAAVEAHDDHVALPIQDALLPFHNDFDSSFSPQSGTGSSSHAVDAILLKLGVPFFDAAILEGSPVAQAADQAPLARRILSSLTALSESRVAVYMHSERGGDAVELGPLLDFDAIPRQERSTLLQLLYTEHLSSPFTTQEMTQLKSLRLFTVHGVGSADAGAVAYDSNTNVYWSSSGPTLHSTTAAATDLPYEAPLVLAHEPSLEPLYRLLGAAELTPSLAAKQYLLPELLHPSTGLRRKLEIVIQLADRYVIYTNIRFYDNDSYYVLFLQVGDRL